MSAPLSNDEIERLANKRARAKMGWFIHLTVYILVNGLMFFAASQGYSRRPWQVYPAMGWGIGLALHGLSVFVLGSGSSLRESMVEKERERIRRQQEARQRDGR